MRCAYPDAGPLRLPQSYADEAGLPRTGFTADAALALLAYLATARVFRASGAAAGLLDGAREIGEGLLYALRADPGAGLARGYALDPYRPGAPARARAGFAGRASGDQAWAGIALCELYRHGGDGRALDGARHLAALVRDGYRCRTGYAADPAGASVSTSDNAALVALFDRLAGLGGGPVWGWCAGHGAARVRAG